MTRRERERETWKTREGGIKVSSFMRKQNLSKASVQTTLKASKASKKNDSTLKDKLRLKLKPLIPFSLAPCLLPLDDPWCRPS